MTGLEITKQELIIFRQPNQHKPKKFASHRSDFQYACRQSFAFIQRWWYCEFVTFDKPTSNSCRHTGSFSRNNHSHSRMSTTSHCTTPSIDQKADEEPRQKYIDSLFVLKTKHLNDACKCNVTLTIDTENVP
jgi:hypothetical protein